MKSVHNAVMGISGEDYQKYIDVDSWIDYIIIQEITKNIDGNFKTSCYLYKQSQDDRLYMTAIWDFDIAFGLTAFNNASAEHNDVEDCVGGKRAGRVHCDKQFRSVVQRIVSQLSGFSGAVQTALQRIPQHVDSRVFALINEQAAYLYNCTAETEENGKRTLITASIFSPIGLRDELNGWILNCLTDRAELPILIML